MAITFILDNPGVNSRLPAREVTLGDGRAKLAQAGHSRETLTLTNDAPVMVFGFGSYPGARVIFANVGPLLALSTTDALVLDGWVVDGDRADHDGDPRYGGRHTPLRGPSGFTGYIARADEVPPARSIIYVCVSGILPLTGDPVRAGWIPVDDVKGRGSALYPDRAAGKWMLSSQWMLATVAT